MLLIVLKKFFLKFMNNTVYGKTMENLRKGINVRLIVSAKNYKKCEQSLYKKSLLKCLLLFMRLNQF